LRRNFDVLHLEEAMEATPKRRRRPIACVTFDDGFADVYENAFPILESFGVPATVFLVTDLIDSSSTVWFARLHQAIIDTSRDEVTFRGTQYSLATAQQRASASTSIQVTLKTLLGDQLHRELEALVDELVPPSEMTVRPEFRMLTSEQILRMQRDDLVRFGAHTKTHQILTNTSPERAEVEILESLEYVRGRAQQPSACFAYPNGQQRDFDERSVEVLRDAGIRFGFTAEEGPVIPGLDPFHLPRYGVGGNDSHSRFVRQVHHGRTIAKRSTVNQPL
jgi:peptidoglycan/xylan/chitin deacetylase (PgdA/CDA1 family)